MSGSSPTDPMLWRYLIKTCAALGMLASLGTALFGVWELATDPSARHAPVGVGFTVLALPVIFVFWRMFLLRRWAGVLGCLLGWRLVADVVGFGLAYASADRRLLCGVIVVMSVAAVAGRRHWQEGI